MTQRTEVIIHSSHAPMPAGVRTFIEERCEAFLIELPELERLEVSLLPEGEGFTAHAHATGRKTNIAATHDWAREMGHAADQVLHKIASRLRRHHDKMRDRGRKANRSEVAA